MFDLSRISKLLRSNVENRILRWQTITLLLTLALILETTGRAMSVSASTAESVPQPAGSSRYKLAVYMPNAPYCAGKDYEVRVRGVEITTIQNFTTDNGKAIGDLTRPNPLLGLKIEASTRDGSIAALSPPERWAMDVEQDEYELGSVYFTIHAKKAGTTDLYFEALISGNYLEATKPITVVNCQYDVTIFYTMLQLSHGTVGNLWGILDSRLEGEGQSYVGTGVLDTSRTESMPPCSFSSPGFKNQTRIAGQITEEADRRQLKLNIEFTPGTSSATITCPIVGATNPTTTEDPTNWLETSATFPENGGRRSFPVNFAQWFGRMTIIVKPVTASSP